MKTDVTDLFDEYAFKARLLPAFLVLLPFALVGLVWTPDVPVNWKLLGGIIVYCGGTLLLAQLGRDLGRRKQETLFLKWGGKPTTKMLRHRHSTLDAITLGRYHKKLSQFLKRDAPNEKTEREDKKGADEFYEAGIKVLLERTRDQKKYPLIFKENINYGFRRNLWGMKPAAILICCLSLLASGVPIAEALYKGAQAPGLALVAVIADAVLISLWVLRITPEWVRLPAEAYALRLLAACEQT